ncbi:MAG: zinc ABC transporter substrate-binding protein [Desulfobacterales bacterium]|jgi:zinc transport system substrate-binding protein|nr:zinc ABC transporter substrate-binding protein [Deltaproteobacteria bacterium]
MKRITELIVIILLTIFFHQAALAADPVPVFVSIAPQKYFVQQISKDLVNVQVMVLPGADPHTYEPKPRQMADLSKTQVYFAIGVPFEHIWLKKLGAANPDMKIVHTDGGIAKIPMATHHHDEREAHHE